MDEAEKMEIIRTKIVPRTKCILKDMDTLFDKQIIDEAQAIRNRHNSLPMEEVLRPFTI